MPCHDIGKNAWEKGVEQKLCSIRMAKNSIDFQTSFLSQAWILKFERKKLKVWSLGRREGYDQPASK